jgi:AmiR/NasT family two-component response regulator
LCRRIPTSSPMPSRDQAMLSNVFCPSSSVHATLVSHLRQLGYAVPGSQADPGAAISIVMIEGPDDEMALRVVSDAMGPVLAVLGRSDAETVAAALSAGAQGLLDLPVRLTALRGQIALAQAICGQQDRLSGKVRQLELTLKARRDIERAVEHLRGQRAISASQAYAELRSMAMARRLSVAEIALSLVRQAG